MDKKNEKKNQIFVLDEISKECNTSWTITPFIDKSNVLVECDEYALADILSKYQKTNIDRTLNIYRQLRYL